MGNNAPTAFEYGSIQQALLGGLQPSLVPLSEQDLVEHPDFLSSIRFLALRLRSMFDAGPRLARLLSSHQRWLLTQAAYALHFQYDPGRPASGLTAVALSNLITGHKIASRNTVLSFIEELSTYRFIACVPGEEHRRPRHFEPTEISQQAMFGWVHANLTALDLLDGAGRASFFHKHPDMMRHLHPRAVMNCIEDSRWREPPERVAHFLWTEAGGLVVDHIIARLEPKANDPERLPVGRIETRQLASEFMMSRTHLQRVFAKAIQSGFIGWMDEARKTDLWVSRAFLRDYCEWQAVKFAYIDEAFDYARDCV